MIAGVRPTLAGNYVRTMNKYEEVSVAILN